jgi:hypothetical protein
MHLTAIARAALRVAAALLIGSIVFGQSASSPSQKAPAGGQSSPGFDGQWVTKMSCPAKGNTEGYTWQFPSTIENSNFHGEHGTAGEPGYLLIEGKIAKDGSAKLSANGIVASRNYARGILAHKGADYSYDIKAKFQETEGTGTRDAGLGIVDRPCTFDFTKQ